MDFQTILSYFLAIIETGALVGALVFYARALHENKLARTQKGNKSAKSKEEIEKISAAYKSNAGVLLFIYLILNLFRNFSGVLK